MTTTAPTEVSYAGFDYDFQICTITLSDAKGIILKWSDKYQTYFFCNFQGLRVQDLDLTNGAHPVLHGHIPVGETLL